MPRVAIALLCTVWTIGYPKLASAETDSASNTTDAVTLAQEATVDLATVTEHPAVAKHSAGDTLLSSGGIFGSNRWTLGGLYAGAHVAYNFGNARTQLSTLSRETSTSDFGILYGGLQIGYLLPLHSRLIVGIETDASFPNFLAGNDVVSSLTKDHADYREAIDCVGHLRSRIGYAWGSSLWFTTGGFAWSRARFTESLNGTNNNNEKARLLPGIVLGAGVEVGVARKWTARLEFLHDEFTWGDAVLGSGASLSSSIHMNSLRLGLNWLP